MDLFWIYQNVRLQNKSFFNCSYFMPIIHEGGSLEKRKLLEFIRTHLLERT